MIKIYMYNLLNAPNAFDEEILKNIPRSRIEKINRYSFLKDKKQCYGAGILINHICKEYNIDINSYKIGLNGKPQLKGIYFNISHSNEIVICAVSDNDIGCDIEMIKQEPKGVAERFFSKNEMMFLLNSNNREEAFYDIWTKKESYLKMVGSGLSQLRDLDVISQKEVKFYTIKIDNYIINVCSTEQVFEKDIVVIE